MAADDRATETRTERPPVDGLAAVREEIRRSDEQRSDRTWLRSAIDTITKPYHNQDQAYRDLTALTQPGTQVTPEAAAKAVETSQAARQREQDAYSIASGALKTAGMFLPGRAGFWMSSSVFAADEVRTNAPSFGDATFGSTKGVLERWAGLRMTRAGVNPAAAVMALGPTNRAIDTALSSRNYTDAQGDTSLSSFARGIARIGTNALDPRALAADFTVAGATYGLGRFAGSYLHNNQFAKIATVSLGTGYAGGLTEELSRQSETGQFSAERLAVYPIARALTSSIASLPGAQRQFVNEYPWQKAGTTRELEYRMVSIAPSEVARITKQGTEVTVRPVDHGPTLGEVERVTVARQTVPQDWLAGIGNRLKSRGFSATGDTEQVRFMSRPTPMPGEQPAPWNMVLQNGFRSLSNAALSRSTYYHGPEVARIMSNFAEPTVKFLGSGAESGAFLLANGTVLKTTREFSWSSFKDVADYGTSPFDAKLLHRPIKMGEFRGNDHLFVYPQEFVRSPVTEQQAAALRDAAPKKGWHFSDYNKYLRDDQVSFAVDQAGINAKGQTVFIDYGARSGPSRPRN